MSRKVKQSNSPCCVYDFTLFDEVTQLTVRNVLKTICKKYCFQLEKGDKTGRQHFQGRISLMTKKRESEIVKILALDWKKFHVSVTSKANRDNEFYVMKEDTRIDGPWTDRNDVFIPRDVLEVKDLYPWQESLRKELSFYHPRRVDIVFDQKGNQGKTLFYRYMQCYENCGNIPYCTEFKALMEFGYALRGKKVYLVDIARALDQKKMAQFYAGIEDLKNGNVFDGRFKFKQAMMDPPRVCVFTNTLPNFKYLSNDRWVFWQIVDKKLEKYVPNVEDADDSDSDSDPWDDSQDADSYSDIEIPPSLMKKGVTKENYWRRFDSSADKIAISTESEELIFDMDTDSE